MKIVAKDFAFEPVDFTLKTSDTDKPEGTVVVSFSNQGAVQHSFGLYTNEDFSIKVNGVEIQPVAPGGSGNTTFQAATKKADLYFRCEIHPTQMKGEIKFE